MAELYILEKRPAAVLLRSKSDVFSKYSSAEVKSASVWILIQRWYPYNKSPLPRRLRAEVSQTSQSSNGRLQE